MRAVAEYSGRSTDNDRNGVQCDRFRGDVLNLRGDWSGAQAWYAKAVKLAPDVPSGYYSWGVALAKYDEALQYAPKWQQLEQARAAAARQS